MIRQIYTGKIETVTQVNHYMFDLTIHVDIPFLFKAGQFISLFIDEKEARPLSLASSPRLSIDQQKIRLIIGPHPEGKLIKYICSLKKGDPIRFRGAFGVFTLENTIFNGDIIEPKEISDSLVFAATSTGIAPLLGMIEYLADIKYQNKVRLYFGLRNQEDICFLEDFLRIKGSINFDYFYSISQLNNNMINSQNISKGYITQNILNNQSNKDYVYICGSTKVVINVTDTLKENNYIKIFTENYG